MKFTETLKKNRDKIAQEWKNGYLQIRLGNTVIKSSNTGQFTNPVHFTISTALDKILDGLLENTETADKTLDDIVRIKAVQQDSPSQTMAFFPQLKNIVRELVKKQDAEKELLEFEAKIDELTFRAFDIYMGCREQIYNIKLQEHEKGIFSGLQQEAACPSSLLDQWDMEKANKNNNLSGGSQ